EAEARGAATCEELQFLAATETRKVVKARQVFVFRADGDSLKVTTISGFSTVDRDAPMVRSVESAVNKLVEAQDIAQASEFKLSDWAEHDGGFLATYPFLQVLWLPFVSRSREVLGGMLLAREAASAEDLTIGKRLATTFAHALSLLLIENRFPKR